MMGPRRDWSDAREKVEAEGRCRVCGITRGLQAAHITRRSFDAPKPGRKTLWVNPDSILPLCPRCHSEYDSHEISILGKLTHPEQLKALGDMGTIEAVRRRTDPLDYTRVIEQARRDSLLEAA
jgi:hypothetical protein